MTKIRFGVIGASRVAQKGVMPALLSSELAELAAIGGRSPDKTAEIAKQFNCENFGSYEDVIKSDAVGAVYVSLPPSLHEEWSIKALMAGKHVYCEKPAATSYASAKMMVKAASENNARLMEGLMFRHHPQNARVMELIRENVLGELLRFDGCFAYAMPDKDSNVMQNDLGGGSLNSCGVYPISASRMVFGEEPISVFCKLKIDVKSGVDVGTDVFLEYPNGKIALASAFFGSYYQSTYSVLGTEAHIRMSRAYAVPRDMSTKIFLDRNDQSEELQISPADHFRLMIDDFCEKILKDGNNNDYENDLLAQARVLEAVKRSHAEKREVKIEEIK